jgi:hypothetical protein
LDVEGLGKLARWDRPLCAHMGSGGPRSLVRGDELCATGECGAADLDRSGNRCAAEQYLRPPGAARARPHHRHLRLYRPGSRRSFEAVCRQQSRLRQLSPSGRNEEVWHPAVRVVRSVSALQRPLRRADHRRGPAQRLHDTQYERTADTGERPGNAGDGGVHQVSIDRRAARAAAAGHGHRQYAGARSGG